MPTPIAPLQLTPWISSLLGNIFSRPAPSPTPAPPQTVVATPTGGRRTTPIPATIGDGTYAVVPTGRIDSPAGTDVSIAPTARTISNEDMQNFLLDMLGDGGGGGDGGSALGWAQHALNERRMQQEAEQFAASLAQAAELARLQREQQQREMAAAIGQTIAQLQSQQWATGLPWRLPSGTQYAPGFEPGGVASRLAQMARTSYTPPQIKPANPPGRSEMEAWLEEAIRRFGPQ